MKILLLTSAVHSVNAPSHPQDNRPTPDLQALRAALASSGLNVETTADQTMAQDTALMTRLARRIGGPGAALAVLAFRHRRQYGAVLTDGAGIGLPLALLFGSGARRPAHLCLGHHLTESPFPWLFRLLGLARAFDTLCVSTQAARDFAEDRLALPAEKVLLISPPVDDRFFRPQLDIVPSEAEVSAAELFALDPAARRAVCARSAFVVAQDDENHTKIILEAMAMGKAVVAIRAEGVTDLLQDGVTGLTALPGDPEGWQRAVARLRADAGLRERLGRSARRWVEEHAAQDRWAARIAAAVCAAVHAPAHWESDALSIHRCV